MRTRMSAAPCRRTAPAFTLVELLVVIGIIALLISILLPSLNSAREQANSIKCLSNLRQLGLAAAAYTSQNKGTLVPADVRLLNPNSPTLKLPSGKSYQDVEETWATILVADGFLTVPEATDTVIPPQSDNVLRCPSGVNEMSAVTAFTSNVPSSRLDSRGRWACCTRRSSCGRACTCSPGTGSTRRTPAGLRPRTGGATSTRTSGRSRSSASRPR